MDSTPTQAVIALVGPDDAQHALLRQLLDRMGHASVAFESMADFDAIRHADRRFDLLLLVWPPDAGWDRLAAVRDSATLPVLLSLREMPDRNFFIGNNMDFLIWPAEASTFEWSVQRMLARFGMGVSRLQTKNEVVCGGFRFFVPQHAVTLQDGRQVHLKPREFELALQLFLNRGRLLSRDWLWSLLWGQTPRPGERSLDVCAAGVRRALGLRPENGMVLHAIYKRGYRLDIVT